MLTLQLCVVAMAAATLGLAQSTEGQPFPTHPTGQWKFYPVEGSHCMSNKETGVWLKYGDPQKLMVYHAQGGACFNTLTCAGAAPDAQPPRPPNTGLFGDDPRNPANNFTIVFIPYCTGDVFAGAAEGRLGGEYRHFAGHSNERLVLDRTVATFPHITDLLVTGESAGGFGAIVNYDYVRSHWTAENGNANVRATLVDDSGPLLDDKFMAPCLQKIQRDAWNFTESLPAECPCRTPGTGLKSIWTTVVRKWPQDSIGLISSLNDMVISTFFAFGLENCNAVLPLGYNKMAAGLRDLATMQDGPAIYMIAGSSHTHSTNGDFLTKKSRGVFLHQWVTDLMAGRNPGTIDPDNEAAQPRGFSNDEQLVKIIAELNKQY